MNYNKEHRILLDKLINGTITNDEKWRLERLSLDDPLLAEALEGYYDNPIDPDTIKGIHFLKKGNTIRLFNPISIAASVILILGLSFVFYLQKESGQMNDSVIMNSDERLPDNTEAISEVMSEETHEEGVAEALEEPKVQNKKTSSTPESVSKTKQRKLKKTNDNQELAQIDSKDLNQSAPGTTGALNKESRNTFYIDGVRVVEQLPPIQAQGIVVDEAGVALVGAEVISRSRSTKVTTDESGKFFLEDIQQNEMLITQFNGYVTDSSIISPDMSIKLKKAESRLSEGHKTLEELMDDNQIIELYRKRLDEIFTKEKINCEKQLTINTIKIQIRTDQNHQIKHLQIMDIVSEECKEAIIELLEDAEYNEVFSSDKELNFIYRLRL